MTPPAQDPPSHQPVPTLLPLDGSVEDNLRATIRRLESASAAFAAAHG